MKIMLVVGARPNFMKIAPLIAAILEHNRKIAAVDSPKQTLGRKNIRQILVHTGQHYDDMMSGSFFVDLEIPKPDIHLGVGSSSHAAQTSQIMHLFEEVLLREKPDVVVVVGDVNSTLACALVAAKISYDANGTRPLIAHVEAGLRSFDRAMPEEVNRVLTDHISDLLFVTEESGLRNLAHEGIAEDRIHFVGNTMIDSLLTCQHRAEASHILDDLCLRNHSQQPGTKNSAARYALLTLHRPSNVDDRNTFLSILEGLDALSRSCPIFFAAHPRTRKRISDFGLEQFFHIQNGSDPKKASNVERATNGIHVLDPLGYLDFLCLMKHAALVVTDSGGIQDETTCLGVPCVTVRENTERPVTVTSGTNLIAGTTAAKIRDAVKTQLSRQTVTSMPDKWDGKAGDRIVEAIVEIVEKSELKNQALRPVGALF